MIYLNRTTAVGLLGAVLIGGACTASQDTGEAKNTDSREVEMVEVTIRLPDGRVIKRTEQRYPSRIDPSRQILNGDRPSVIDNHANKSSTNGAKLNSTGSGASGGSNGSSGSLTKAGGSGSGGSSAGGGGSSSGSGGGGTPRGRFDGDGGDSGNALAAWSYSSPLSVQPDNDFTVRIYAWRNPGARFQHVTKNYVAYPRNKTPHQLAALLANQIRNEQPEKIVIRLLNEFDPATRYPLDITNPRELILQGGYSAGIEEYWGEFALELKSRGIIPDYIVFDMEDSIDYYHIPKDVRESFFSELLDENQPFIEILPESLREVSVTDLMSLRTTQSKTARLDYDQFAVELRENFIQREFVDLFERVFEKYIPTSNYRNVNPTFYLENFGNKPFPVATIGGISAPSCYLERYPDFGRYKFIQKDLRWNRLIDNLNACRSTAANGLVTPWVSAPGYGRDASHTWARSSELAGENRIWEIMMGHMLAMGIDTFILWNPTVRYNPNAVETDAFIDRWLAEHPRVSGPQLSNLREIPLDADQIVTNGVVTTYEEFMDAMSNR